MATGTIQHHLALLGPSTSNFICTLTYPVYRIIAFTTFIGGRDGTLYCRSSKDKCTRVPPCQIVPSTTNPLDVSSQNVMIALPVKEIPCLKAIYPALLLHRSKSQLLSLGGCGSWRWRLRCYSRRPSDPQRVGAALSTLVRLSAAVGSTVIL